MRQKSITLVAFVVGAAIFGCTSTKQIVVERGTSGMLTARVRGENLSEPVEPDGDTTESLAALFGDETPTQQPSMLALLRAESAARLAAGRKPLVDVSALSPLLPTEASPSGIAVPKRPTSEEIAADLAGALANESANVRIRALQSAIALRETRVLPEIRRLLAVSDPSASLAAEALGIFRDRHSVRLLIKTADRTQDGLVRISAVRALGLIGDRRATRTLRRAMDSANYRIRSEAAVSLGLVGGPKALKTLRARFGDEGEVLSVRLACAWGMVHLGDDSGSELMRKVVLERVAGAEVMGIWGLAEVGGESAAASVVQALDSERDEVALAAASALDIMGLPEVERALARAAKLGRASISFRATIVLARVRPDLPAAAPCLQRGFESGGIVEGVMACGGLARMPEEKAPEAIRLLRRAASSSSRTVRLSAFEALARRAAYLEVPAAEALIGAAITADAPDRAEIANRLARLARAVANRFDAPIPPSKDSGEIELLEEMALIVRHALTALANDRSPGVRVIARRALASSGREKR